MTTRRCRAGHRRRTDRRGPPTFHRLSVSNREPAPRASLDFTIVRAKRRQGRRTGAQAEEPLCRIDGRGADELVVRPMRCSKQIIRFRNDSNSNHTGDLHPSERCATQCGPAGYQIYLSGRTHARGRSHMRDSEARAIRCRCGVEGHAIPSLSEQLHDGHASHRDVGETSKLDPCFGQARGALRQL